MMDNQTLMDQSADLWNNYLDIVREININGTDLQKRNVAEHTEVMKQAVNLIQANVAAMEMEKINPEFYGVGIVYGAKDFEYIPRINKSGPFRYIPTGKHYTGQELMEKLGMTRVEADKVISKGIQMPEVRTRPSNATPGLTVEQYDKLIKVNQYDYWLSLVSSDVLFTLGKDNNIRWADMTPELRDLWVSRVCDNLSAG